MQQNTGVMKKESNDTVLQYSFLVRDWGPPLSYASAHNRAVKLSQSCRYDTRRYIYERSKAAEEPL